jgi:hypothetical protein
MHRRDIFKQLFSGDLMKHLQNDDEFATRPEVFEKAETINGFRLQQCSTEFSTVDTGAALRIEILGADAGWLHCSGPGSETVMQLQTHQLSTEAHSFSASLSLQFMDPEINRNSYAGIRFGGEGAVDTIDAGVTANGHLFIGRERSVKSVDRLKLQHELRLCLNVIAQAHDRSYAKLKLLDTWGNTIMVLNSCAVAIQNWSGTISLVSISDDPGAPSVAFSCLQMEGEKLQAVDATQIKIVAI